MSTQATALHPRVEPATEGNETSAPYAETRETHSAVVFLVGDRAYKLKKPVDLGFLDFSTREKRLEVCRREVSLNRRLAPDVYLGVSDVSDVDNRLLDHLVVMKRMPADRRLSYLVRRGVDLHAEVRELAHVLAAFHSHCAQSAKIAARGDRAALALRWDSNFAGSQPFVGSVLDRDRVGEVERLARRFLAGRDPLFTDRLKRGAVVEGHGDLLAEDIFCLPDGPRILDCIEFDDNLRHLDQLDDIACLAMDLEHQGAPDLGQHFVDCYLELSGDNAPVSLVHHYIAYRAFMRAKVACLRHAQSGKGAAEARQLLDQAHRHLTEGRVSLILVGGAPGSGKSTTASGIADELGFTVLSSDRVRKELAGVAAETSRAAPYGEGIYTRAWTERTYAELLRRAELLLGMGESVVLDATWSARKWREDAARLAEATSSDLCQLRCEVADTVADARIDSRITASDADARIAAALRACFETWPEAVAIDTTQPIGDTVASAVEVVRPPVETGRVVRPRMLPD
jgi:aminoglycoside phosphotransferase family enzyme/predicted kinase